jgi:hypothetical protein
MDYDSLVAAIGSASALQMGWDSRTILYLSNVVDLKPVPTETEASLKLLVAKCGIFTQAVPVVPSAL